MESRQQSHVGMTNTATFLKDITDDISVKSTNPTQQSPLRQVFPSTEDGSSPVQNDRPGSTSSSSGKSTVRSSDEKSTHESSDDESSLSSDPNEDLSLAEPTTLMDPMSFYTARAEENSSVHTPMESPDESFRTARQAQTPHPNASNSLNSSLETKSRSVRFAPPNDFEEASFAFDFTPQLPPSSPDRPTTPQPTSSTKNTPHNSPLKLFSQYDTFTNNKLEDMVANLLPPPEDEEEETRERERKRARREAMSRDRVPRIGGAGGEIRSHVRVPSLTTQEMFDDAEDFMRDLRSMPRPTVETPDSSAKEASALEETELSVVHEEPELPQQEESDGEPSYEEYDDQNSSEFEEHPHHHHEYSHHSESSAYDSIRQTPSPGKLIPRSPLSNTIPPSRISSAESMQTIAPHEVKHLIPNKIGSMTFNEAQKVWFKDRPSTLRTSAQTDVGIEEDEDEDIFADIEDLVVSDEEEEQSLGTGSRPGSSEGMDGTGVSGVPLERHEMEENAFEEAFEREEARLSPGGKERGSAQEYLQEIQQPQEPQERKVVVQTPASPVAPPKSPLRKSISCSPLPSPLNSPAGTRSQVSSPTKSIHGLPPSPLRKPLQTSTRQTFVQPMSTSTTKPAPLSPVRSPHRKTPSTDTRMRKSLPLPPLDTPDSTRQSPHQPRPNSNLTPQPLRHSQYKHLLTTPKPAINSPFLDPGRSLPFSAISPPPADISFAHTPRPDVSFSVTTRALVKHLTDFEPFEPYWEQLLSVNLRGKGVVSLDGLKTFCPKLQELDVSGGKVHYLTGLPKTLRVLKASGNRLTGLVSFAWGKNLQYLDLANNEIDHLAGTTTSHLPCWCV